MELKNFLSLSLKLRKIYVLFDGNNIAISREGKKIVAFSKRLKNILEISQSLISDYIDVIPLIFIDYGLQKIIDDRFW